VLYEWRIDLRTGSVKEQALDDLLTEFPKPNDATWGTRARYSYNPKVAARADVAFDGLVKYDLHQKTRQLYEYPHGWVGSEVVFVAKPGATTEDGGWLLTFATHLGERRSELQIFEAAAVEEGPIAQVGLPQQVPVGFHSCWAPL
jgi:carotenoid cleavage dioxygenase-like enzyme